MRDLTAAIGSTTGVDEAWCRLRPMLYQAGVQRVAFVGVAPATGNALRSQALRRGLECLVVDGLRHHTSRRARDVEGWADLVVICVSGPIAHRVSGLYQSVRPIRPNGRVARVRARGAEGITRELERWLSQRPGSSSCLAIAA